MTGLRNLLRALFRHDAMNTEMNEEMRQHLDQATERLMARGLSRSEAESAARREFGNVGVLAEEGREARGASWVDTARSDLRYALRSLRHSPTFTVVAVASLAIGVGANTAIFGLINAVMLRPLPVPQADQIAVIAANGRRIDLTNPLYEALRDQLPRDVPIAASGPESFNLASGGEERPASGEYVSGSYFGVLGVRPALGHLIAPADDYRGCPPVIVVSNAFWRSQLGARKDVVGTTLPLNGVAHTIVGVASPRFSGFYVGEPTSLFVPLCRGPSLEGRTFWWLTAIVRRGERTPASLDEALARASRPTFTAAAPARYTGDRLSEFVSQRLSAQPASAGISGPRDQYGKALLALMAMVATVLLISCANVANLMLARGAARGREFAIRAAIGASRSRLVRHMVTEGMLLAAAGAALGIVLAIWTNRALVALMGSSLEVPIDGRVLVFTAGVATAAVMLCGVVPAWRATRIDPAQSLKSHGAARGSTRFRIGRTLVVAQCALALTVVTTAGLLVTTLSRLSGAAMGFEPAGVVIATIDFRREQGGLGANLELQRSVLDGIKAIPGVRDAAISNLTPVGGGAWNNPISTDYLPPVDPSSKGSGNVPWFNSVSPDYFRTLQTRLVAGRDFDDRDSRTAPRVAIVNEAAVRAYFGGESVLGKTFRMGEQGGLSDPITIVGVVENATYRSLRASNEPTFYLAAAQDRDSWAKPSYVVRADLAPSAVMEGIKGVAARIDRRMSLRFTTLEEKISQAVRRERVMATLSAVFGGIAFLLSMIGLYGVMAYTVARRRVEIGVRIALGAARSQVVQMVLGDIARMMAVGVALGATGAFFVTPLVKQFLYGVEPNDPATLVMAVIVLLLGALAAGAIPARRAAGLQPLEALRED